MYRQIIVEAYIIACLRTHICKGKTNLQCLHYLPKIIYCLLELEDISESKVMKRL